MNTKTSTNLLFNCNWCNRQVNGVTYISGTPYCAMCASIINKNNQNTINIDNINIKDSDSWNPNDIIKQLNESFELNGNACDNCSVNPKNGGNGICHCILGSMQITC